MGGEPLASEYRGDPIRTNYLTMKDWIESNEGAHVQPFCTCATLGTVLIRG